MRFDLPLSAASANRLGALVALAPGLCMTGVASTADIAVVPGSQGLKP
jgi:hypothetical protein